MSINNTIHLANFTMHQQSIYLDCWNKQGFKVEPMPQAPRVSKDLTEVQVYQMVKNKIRTLSHYDGILLGGLTNLMCYAWHACAKIDMPTYIIKSPRTSAELIKMSGITEIQANGWDI